MSQQGKVKWVSRPGLTTLLLAGFLVVLVTAFVAPALATVGEPVEGAEVFLSRQPGDDPVINTDTGGGYEMGTDGSIGYLVVPAGTLLPGVNVSIDVYQYRTPAIAQNGHKVRIIAKLGPDGAGPFTAPVTLALAAPAGAKNAQAYYYDGVQQEWVSMASSKSGNKVTSEMGHFSWYGIGWDDDTTAVPASSSWSLGLLALIGGAILFVARRSSRSRAS